MASTAAADQVSYEDLYARWERGNWRATEIDFTQDRRDWTEAFSDLERRAALWNYALFFWGEDAVADNLSPFIDAAPREEQKYFLATQQADEARHAVFFKRFMREVCDIGDGTVSGGLEAIRPQLTWGFVKTFELLDKHADELRRDRSRTKLAQAVTLYHVIIEATLAQPGQHFIEDYLKRKDVLPGFRGGMRNVALDEQRHIGFGVKLLRDLAAEDPEVPLAVADLLREVLPYSAGVFIPPGWDRRYAECFGFTLEEIYAEGGRSFESKLRAAGMPVESLPGPIPYPFELDAGRARPAHHRHAPGGADRRGRGGLAPARPGDDGAAVRLAAARGRPSPRAAGPGDAAVGLPRRRAMAPAPRQRQHDGRARLRRGRRRHLPRPLRRLRRGVLGPARPAPGARHRTAAPARIDARAVGHSTIVRLIHRRMDC